MVNSMISANITPHLKLPWKKYIFPFIDIELDNTTCFGHWNISRSDRVSVSSPRFKPFLLILSNNNKKWPPVALSLHFENQKDIWNRASLADSHLKPEAQHSAQLHTAASVRGSIILSQWSLKYYYKL